MLELLAAFFAGCALVSLLYYYMEIRGEQPDYPETRPPTDFLSEPTEEDQKELWKAIK